MLYVVLAVVPFSIGGIAALTRENTIIALLGAEVMLSSCNLALMAFSRMRGNVKGRISAFFIMVVVAVEVVVGLAIVTPILITHRSAPPDSANQLKY